MDDTTAAIKDAVDIVQVIGEYIRVEPFGSKFRALCPFHDDKKPSFQIDPTFQNYRCWSCQAKGDVFTFVQEIEKISFVEAKQRLASRAGIAISSGSAGSNDNKQQLYRVLAWAAKEFQNSLFESDLGAAARQYLESRGFSEGTIRQYGLGFAPQDFEWLVRRARKSGFGDEILVQAGLATIGKRGTPYDFYRGRVIVPVRDTQGRVLSFGGRVLPDSDDGNGPKYLNSRSTDVYNKSRVLYGLDVTAEALRSRPRKAIGDSPSAVVVMEGYMDCLMAYQVGLCTAVATCGTALTAEHVNRLKSYSERVVLMFDGDDAGQNAASNATTMFLSSEVDLRLCVLPDGLDPCDYILRHGVDELNDRIKGSPDALEYSISQARADYDTQGLDGRSKAVDRVLGMMATMPQMPRGSLGQRVDLAINRIAEGFRLDEPTVRRRLAELRGEADTRTATFRDEPRGPEKMSTRERTIAELIVGRPGMVGELRSLAPAEGFQHSGLRRIVETGYDLFGEMGEDATTDALRERLDDSQLDSLVFELADTCPKAEAFDKALSEVCRSLEEHRRQRELAGAIGLSPSADADEHLAALRELHNRNAL